MLHYDIPNTKFKKHNNVGQYINNYMNIFHEPIQHQNNWFYKYYYFLTYVEKIGLLSQISASKLTR